MMQRNPIKANNQLMSEFSTSPFYSSGSSENRDGMRITTAPNQARPKYLDTPKSAYTQLPAIRGKNLTRQIQNKERQGRRPKREEQRQHEQEEQHKRPQTSKGSRGNKVFDSEYYEEDGDDLVGTTKQLEMFKKISREHPCGKN